MAAVSKTSSRFTITSFFASLCFDLLQLEKPDVLFLQETKLQDAHVKVRIQARSSSSAEPANRYRMSQPHALLLFVGPRNDCARLYKLLDLLSGEKGARSKCLRCSSRLKAPCVPHNLALRPPRATLGLPL